jgi:hypothetical protein
MAHLRTIPPHGRPSVRITQLGIIWISLTSYSATQSPVSPCHTAKDRLDLTYSLFRHTVARQFVSHSSGSSEYYLLAIPPKSHRQSVSHSSGSSGAHLLAIPPHSRPSVYVTQLGIVWISLTTYSTRESPVSPCHTAKDRLDLTYSLFRHTVARQSVSYSSGSSRSHLQSISPHSHPSVRITQLGIVWMSLTS